MKRILSSIITACISFSAFSQIPNPGFENWTSTGFPAYQNPNSWGNLNGATAITGTLTCERGSGADAHSGSYAIKLTSKSVFGQSAPGIAVTGTINTGTQELEGGFAYTQRPTHLKGWYKYSPVSGDNGEVRVTLWRRSPTYEQVGEGVILPNTSIPNYTMFLVPITYTSANAPDSGRILLVSTNTDNIRVGSQLIVDDLEFIDCSSLSVSLSTTDVTIVGGADGTATATPAGGTAPFSYFWSPSAQTTQTITNLGTGDYCVTISDANGCTATSTCAAVSEPDCSGFSVSVTTTDAATQGGTDGTATVNITGATGTSTILWSNAASDTTIAGLGAGTYCATVTDGVGCTASDCEVVSDPSCSGFSVSLVVTNVSTAGGNDGEIIVTPDGGTPPYTYTWSDGGTGQNLMAGNYCVTVTDSVGCQDIECATVTEPLCIGVSVSVTTTNVSTVGGNDGTATATPVGGSAPYIYAWSNGDTAQTITGLIEGNYCVTMTTGSGCNADTCVAITEPDCSGFSMSVTTTDETAAGADDGTASANAAGSVSYLWSNGSTTQSITGLTPGQYCVTATNDSGCIVTACDSVQSGPVGIANLESAGIRLFPNPASEQITIQMQHAADYLFTLFDVRGKLVLEKIIGTSTSAITVADFPTGNYFVELKNLMDGSISYGKLVKE